MANDHPSDDERKILLIVEDDKDLLQVLVVEFSERFDVLTARNGQEAMDLVLEQMPDIVISDVMMPVMDGIELCNQLKQSVATSHIPLILLTSRTSVEDQIKGLKTGADQYIPKPFHTELLETHIDNLIENRRKLRKQLGQEFIHQGAIPSGPDSDKAFISKTHTILAEHLADSEFRSEQLARELGMSLRSLQRKMKAVIDETPAKFITDYRMRHAANLLAQSTFNITEVAYAVGFENASSFAQIFKGHFNCSPSEYRAIHQQK